MPNAESPVKAEVLGDPPWVLYNEANSATDLLGAENAEKSRKNAEAISNSIQSKREAKPQRFAGTSQLILVQSLLYIKSSTNDCNYTTISFNTIQFAFL